MKKCKLTILFIFFVCISCFANHITGGEMYYTYVQQLPGGVHRYKVTLKLYRDCAALATLDPYAHVAAFANDGSQAMVLRDSVKLTSSSVLTLDATTFPCISNPPVICYEVGFYEFTVDLPASTAGYTIAYQRCCRIAGINNIFSSNFYGTTITAIIPGSSSRPNAPINNSAQFIGQDLVVVCANSSLTYNFGAIDKDAGDSLVYYFDAAYTGGGQAIPSNGPTGAAPSPPTPPPYTLIEYVPPYSSSQPLGPLVTINPATGLITGIAPEEGIYVVTVYVDEFRNGVKIATQRKDLQIKVADCLVAEAKLEPLYLACGVDSSLTFSNNSNSPLITSYYWTFGDPGSGAANTSTAATPTHNFSDTGTYVITLITNRGQDCTDTATAIAKVYPGFFPDFAFQGICISKPTSFFDRSSSTYGTVNSWFWDFGDATTLNDTSHKKDTTYTYTQTGPKNVSLVVTDTKGCRGTVVKTITIVDKPPLSVAFKDTLICRGDAVQLQAIGSGTFSWTPTTNMVDATSPTPTVSPVATTKYQVQLNDNGCLNTDSVTVNVVSVITLQTGPPVVICLTDSVQLSATSNGLRFQWEPASQISNPTILNPVARPTIEGLNTYRITAFLGGCQPATADFIVRTVPYPTAIAQAADDTICFQGFTQLSATITGSTFTWSPVTGLSGANTLTPVAAPLSTTRYILSVTNPASGCPKPSYDTVVVTVLPKIVPFAGRDTVVVINQPLQFNASGGVRYVWSPGTDLSNINIPNPVGKYRGNYDSIKYKVTVYNEQNCFDSAFVAVRIFKTTPQVFVPTGFTPNRDGKNDVIRPIAAGIQKLEYFRIYNRWGQLVFSTTENGRGWDGRIKGQEQGTNVFVWIVKAIDYTGKEFFAKGTVTLIR